MEHDRLLMNETRGQRCLCVTGRLRVCRVLRRRAEQSGVPRNGHVFHLTLATWERLTFNFGFDLSLITVRDRHAQTSAPRFFCSQNDHI